MKCDVILSEVVLIPSSLLDSATFFIWPTAANAMSTTLSTTKLPSVSGVCVCVCVRVECGCAPQEWEIVTSTRLRTCVTT